MYVVRNVFAIIGLLTVIVITAALVRFGPVYSELKTLDPKAPEVYANMAERLVATRSAAGASVWKVPVKEGLTEEDVEQAMRTVANEHNIKNVGELPLSKQVEAMGGKPYRTVKIFMFCNALTAARMLDYNDAFSAYLPCRITMVKDKEGKLWLYALDMDMMIYGGEPLPAALKTEAIEVRKVILDIMKRGASGDF